jgi:molybdate transport system ATP-binding protein
MQGVVAEVSAGGAATLDIRLDCNGEALTARLTRYSAERLHLAPGVPVFALIKTVALGGPARGSRNMETGDA